MKHWSLKSKGLIYIILVAFFPLLIVGINNYQTSKDEVIAMRVDKIQLKQEAEDSMIATNISAIINELSILARSNVFASHTYGDIDQFLQKELNVLEDYYAGIGFVDTKLNISYESKKDKHTSFITTPSKEVEVVIDGKIHDKQGQVLAYISVPVYGENNEFRGSLFSCFYYPPNYYRSSNYHMSMESTYMYSLEGELIFHPNLVPYTQEKTGKFDGLIRQYIKDFAHIEAGYNIVKYNSDKYVVVHRVVNEEKWIMVEIVPMSVINSETFPVFVRIFLIVFISIIVTSVFFYLFFNSITRRLFEIVKVTKQGANGTFNVNHLDASVKDEIGLLSHSINGMMQRLENMFNRLDAVINQNQSPVLVLDEYYRFSYLNKAAEELLGVKSETVIGKFTPISFMDFEEVEKRAQRFSEETGQKINAGPDLFIELRKLHANYDMEFTIVSADGKRVPVYDRSSSVRDKNGKMVGIISILQDLSEHRQVEQARNRLQEIVESARDLIASVDGHSNIIYMNEAGRRLLGIQNIEVANLSECLPVHVHQQLIDFSSHAREKGHYEFESQFINRLGEQINVSISIVSHKDIYTGELLYSCIARDITELLDTQKKLVEANEIAENAAAAKGNFLALMSHEIRTPLNGIIGLTQLLKKTKLDSMQREYAAKISDSSDMLLSIVNDILDFSKLEVSKVVIEQHLFNVMNVVEHVTTQVSHYLGGKDNFEFKVNIDDHLPKLLIGDSLRLEQILNNLCVNAVKFTMQGMVELSLTVERIDEEDKKLMLKFIVSDTGIGMTETQLAKLFTPFSQADSSTTRKFGGTGLGLVISKNLVELMGGELNVASELNKGSEFSFTIEFSIPEQVNENDYTNLPDNSYFAWVIEDNPDMKQYWMDLLAKQHIDSISMSSWKEGYYRLCRLGEGVAPSFIIIDMEMPDMYGIETWINFKEEAQKLGIPVVVLTTTFGKEELAMLDREFQPHLVLIKPIHPYYFQKTIFEIIYNLNVRQLDEQLTVIEHHEVLFPDEEDTGEVLYHVLLAEDNKINQLVAEEMLKLARADVTIANNGLEAIQLVEQKQFNLIFMDIHMPEMDGIEATKWIRARKEYDHIPIVAVTANILADDHDSYIEIGMQHVMTKPVELTGLINTLKKYVNQPQENEQNQKPRSIQQKDSKVDVDKFSLCQKLDVEQALFRLNGKKNIYLHMLEQFKLDYSHFIESLEQHIAVENLKTIQRMLHTLKGASSYLGASSLYQTVSKMEKSAKEANVVIINEHIKLLKDELSQVLQEIDELLTIN